MYTVTSFDLVPASPFSEAELNDIRAKLETYTMYYEEGDALYVLFGSAEEKRETIMLFTRATAPTYDAECVVQIRSDRLRIHPGGPSSALIYLRDFVAWTQARGPHQLVRAGKTATLDELLPPVADLSLA
ncbi:MAG: hypothetical protein KTR25_11390 [Myxococcales bacterium]|nr:hypothetical protein [Myxococcales bacterium]